MNESNAESLVLRLVNIINNIDNESITKLSNSDIEVMKTKSLNEENTQIFKRKHVKK